MTASDPCSTPVGPGVGRVIHKADFEAMLSAPSRQRSAHFALHHLPGGPVGRHAPGSKPVETELSTDEAHGSAAPVDKLMQQQWLGTLVPKRHARRSVTRSLLKRQMRHCFIEHAAALPAGRWLLRLKAPFAVVQYPSAASSHLARDAGDELRVLLARASRPQPGA